MSEYQRYEFMTSDRPLTSAQLAKVKALSSHIDASSTHAVIEYYWGNFKYDPKAVLRDYFDGFLYWANWGSPELAFRFPHGTLPLDLLDDYLRRPDLTPFMTLTTHTDVDVLAITFGELEPPDVWEAYELGSLMPLREELLNGDPRPLYIVWLASQLLESAYLEQDDLDDDLSVDAGMDAGDADVDAARSQPPSVPPALGAPTSAQQALADLLRVPPELLLAAARHSDKTAPAGATPRDEELAAWVRLLPAERREDYLVRLARQEPGLSRLLLRELRELHQGRQRGTLHQERSTGERVSFTTLDAESTAIREQLDREQREQERLAHERHLQEVHDSRDAWWQRAEEEVTRGSGPGYDEAARRLGELREAAEWFQETPAFTARFRDWVRPHLRRPAFVQRLRQQHFPLPES